jgi:DNA-binding CsgD family transcriptional regulator
MRNGIGALVHAHRDEGAVAEEYLAAVADIDFRSGIDFMIAAKALVEARVVLATSAGDLAGALEQLSVWLGPAVDENPHARAMRADQLPVIIQIALVLGDLDTARAALARADADAEDRGDQEQEGWARVGHALIDDDPGPLLAATERFAAAGRPLAQAFTAEEAAVRLAQRDDEAGARSAFNQAMAAYLRLGAAADIRRIRARLRPHGIRPGSRTAHRRATTGWDSLTDAEEKVVLWVGEGYSNPEIAGRLSISRRTVETHVAHVLRKLGLRSRRDIMLAVQARRP